MFRVFFKFFWCLTICFFCVFPVLNSGARADVTNKDLPVFAEKFNKISGTVKKIEGSSAIVDGCYALFGKVLTHGDIKQADIADGKCPVGKTLEEFNNLSAKEQAVIIVGLIKGHAEITRDASVELLGGDDANETAANLDQLRLMSVTAGDHGTGHTCKGNEPLQRVMRACFAVEDSTKKTTTFKSGKQKSCQTTDPVTVAGLCGYRPSPQGKNSIQIYYKCGTTGEPRLFATRDNTKISIKCDTGVLLSKTSLNRSVYRGHNTTTSAYFMATGNGKDLNQDD